MNNYMYLVPVAAVIALLFAAYLAAKVSRQDAGNRKDEGDCRCNQQKVHVLS